MEIIDQQKDVWIKFREVVRKQTFRYAEEVYMKIDEGVAFNFNRGVVDNMFSPDCQVEIVDTKLIVLS